MHNSRSVRQVKVKLSLRQLERATQKQKDRFSYEPGVRRFITVSDLARYLKIPTVKVLDMFRISGASGLSARSEVSPSNWNLLFRHLSAQDEAEAKAKKIYEAPELKSESLIHFGGVHRKLLQELAKRPELLRELNPRKFEEIIAEILEDQGCEVGLTKSTRDGGYDIIGTMSGGPSPIVFVAECKRYAMENKVGVHMVRSLYGVTEREKANLGLLITTSDFSRDARNEQVLFGPRIGLKNFDDLRLWLARYAK